MISKLHNFMSTPELASTNIKVDVNSLFDVVNEIKLRSIDVCFVQLV